MGSIFKVPLDSCLTESCWLRILGPRVRWARTNDNVGNDGILTLIIAVRLLSL